MKIKLKAQNELYLQIYLAEKAMNGQFRGNKPEKLKRKAKTGTNGQLSSQNR